MFITGPDVVKTVTGEEVTLEELGGAMSHASKSGVATFVSPDEKVVPRGRALPAVVPALQQPRGAARRRDRPTIPSACAPALRELLPASPNQPYDMKRSSARSSTTASSSSTSRTGPSRSCAASPGSNGQPVGVVGNQPMVLAGVLDIESAEKAARFVRTCDAFNIPLDHLRRRARVPARRRPGVRRHHPPRRQAALRLLRGDRAPHPGHHPQGLRRRLRGDELQVDRRRPVLRLADGRAGRHGAPGRGRDRLPARAAAGRRPGRPAGPSWSPSTPRSTPTRTRPPSGATSTTSSTRPRRASSSIAGLEMLRTKREELPRRKHGNMPL